MEDNAREDRAEGMCLENEGGDDAEVATASANGPKELLVLVSAGHHLLAVGQYDLGG